MALGWMDQTGHRPIALIGGGTSMVGDPTGRTQARKLLTEENIKENMAGIKPQTCRFISLEDGRGLLIDNSEWLLNLNYITFLRDIGRHFSVNRMLTAESYKSRLETGLSFLEFNYMIMQAYDFLTLYESRGTKVQLGGQDQWGNIVAGVELIRRFNGGDAYGATLPLLIDPRTGEKFGKTNAGAIWLNQEKTSVYDFYQFWRNIDDQETGRLLSLFTYLPLEECQYLSRLPGNLINRSKEILAYEVTAICHGHSSASEAFRASVRAFGATDPKGDVQTTSQIAAFTNDEVLANLPTVTFTLQDLENTDMAQLFVMAGLATSKGEARRLIRQGGAYADDKQINPNIENQTLKETSYLSKNQIVLRAGKKRYKIVKIADD
jgi:tyrosyl-tRNA synthetase